MNFKTNADRMEFALRKAMHTDVTFLLGENSDIEVKANSFVLSVGSSVFEKMFFGNFNNERTFEIPDASHDNFYKMIKFIYCEYIDVTLENVTEIMNLAKKYMVLSLENYCKEFGLKNLTIDNVMETLRFAEAYEIHELKDECISVIQYNTEDILGSSKFGLSEVKTILSLNSLSTSENNLCKFIFEHVQETDTIIADTGKNIRQKLGDSFNLLRFLTLSVEEFLEIVYKYKNMFTHEETIGILMKISLAVETSEIQFSSSPRTVISSFDDRHLYSLDINKYAGAATIVDSKIDWKEMKFSVNKKVWICGVEVFVKNSITSKTVVFLKFIDTNGKTILENMEKHKPVSQGTTAFKINFGRQCLIQANTDYTICIKYEDTIGPFYYGTNTLPPKRNAGNNTEFDFKSNDKAFKTLYFNV